MGQVISASKIQPSEADVPIDRTLHIVANINKEFKVKTSAYDPSKYVIEAHEPQRYPYGVTIDTVYWYLKGIGSPMSKTDLRLLVREPNYFPPADPIKEYFDSIRGSYQGKSHIDLLCTHIKARIFQDKQEDYYQQRVNTLIRKWMVACVAQWLADFPNDVALGIVSAKERIGKTYLTNYLIPDMLQEYYTKTGNNDKFFLGDFFTRYMIICFDELVGINRGKGRIEEFKQYMRDRDIMVQRRTDEFPVLRKRLAAATFTTNRVAENGGFLDDNFGNTRFGTIEVDDIDRKYSEICDKNQMWAEALLLFESTDFDYSWTSEIEDLKEYNQKYFVTSDEAKYVLMYTQEPTDENNEDEWMSASEFLLKLKEHRKIPFKEAGKLKANLMGYALTNAGYQKKSKRKSGDKIQLPMYRYHFSLKLNED